jgi:hypothetical protein
MPAAGGYDRSRWYNGRAGPGEPCVCQTWHSDRFDMLPTEPAPQKLLPVLAPDDLDDAGGPFAHRRARSPARLADCRPALSEHQQCLRRLMALTIGYPQACRPEPGYLASCSSLPTGRASCIPLKRVDGWSSFTRFCLKPALQMEATYSGGVHLACCQYVPGGCAGYLPVPLPVRESDLQDCF